MSTRTALLTVTVGLVSLGSGCLTADKKVEAKKPDVTQPGVLPPPQAMARPVTSDVVPAGGTAAPAEAVPAAPVAVAGGASPITKLTSKMERKVIATELAVGWRGQIAYLPDPTRNGQMSPGVAGQMFLFGPPPKMEFALADGVLTVDLIDETPRPAGQPAAKPERWQFGKEILRNLQTRDETFGRSYVLFLPWPSYKPDITRVRISARYDPEVGHTLYATPTVVTFDGKAFGAPVWSEKDSPAPGAWPNAAPGQPIRATAPPVAGAPIPLGGSPFAQPPAGGMPLVQPGAMMPLPNANAPAPMMPLPGNAAAPIPLPSGAAPMMPLPGGPIPLNPHAAPMPGMAPGNAPPVSAVPMPGVAPGAAVPQPSAVPMPGVAPGAVTPPDGLPPIGLVLPGPARR